VKAVENVTEVMSAKNDGAAADSPQESFATVDNGGQPEFEQAAATDAAERILRADSLLGIEPQPHSRPIVPRRATQVPRHPMRPASMTHRISRSPGLHFR
jgi:hypothetical protein